MAPANRNVNRIVKFLGKKRGNDTTFTETETMSLMSPNGDKPGALGMFALTNAEDTETHMASVRQFSSYMICSMYLAGVDRAYGGLHTEIARLMTATQESSRNTVIDFALIKNMLSTPVSSIASFEMGRPDHGVNELELASELAYVLDAGFSKFLFGKEREKRKHEDDEMFEVRVGATDPNARAHEFAGSKRVTATPSVHTYLTLTLLDPYAYGISEKRAVLMFIVSVIQRAIARNTRPEDFEEREKKDEIDAEIDERADLALLTQDTLVDGDEEEAARIRKAILSMPTFKKFTQCLRDHGSDVAHTSNPAFHAQYTLLKATYLVHFASYYLAMAVNSVLRDEMNLPEPVGKGAKAEDRKCTLSRPVVSAMEGAASPST